MQKRRESVEGLQGRAGAQAAGKAVSAVRALRGSVEQPAADDVQQAPSSALAWQPRPPSGKNKRRLAQALASEPVNENVTVGAIVAAAMGAARQAGGAATHEAPASKAPNPSLLENQPGAVAMGAATQPAGNNKKPAATGTCPKCSTTCWRTVFFRNLYTFLNASCNVRTQ